MSDGTLLLILVVPAFLAFAFGIWAGLGYPGMYDKDAKTGKAPRESPLTWLLRGGRRPLTSEMKDEEDEEDLEVQDSNRLSFDRGRRFRQ